MRYIPMSRYSIAEIEKQCRDAINRPAQSTPAPAPVRYAEVLQFYRRENTSLAA